MINNISAQYKANVNEPVMSTKEYYLAFKERMEAKANKPKQDGNGVGGFGNTVVLTSFDTYGNIGVIDFKGFTVSDCEDWQEDEYGCISLARFQNDLTMLAVTEGIDTIVINFDSGGGYTMGLEETQDLVKNIAATKKVYAYTSGMMCSAAYAVAVNCTNIIASPSAWVGSVGTYCEYFNYSDMLKQQGISYQVFQSGTQKTIGNPYGAPLIDEQAKAIQTRIDGIGADFRALVRSARGDIADEYLQGQYYTGKEAMTLKTGLIDGTVNSLTSFLELISEENN